MPSSPDMPRDGALRRTASMRAGGNDDRGLSDGNVRRIINKYERRQ